VTVGEPTLAVVGANVAGVAAAETARKSGYRGKIVLIGSEAEAPYDRPPLSKQVLNGEWDLDRVALRRPEQYAEAGIDMMLGHTAVGLDLRGSGGEVVLDGGQHVSFTHLLIATGVRPATLPFGHNLANVHVLRSGSDALKLHEALGGGGPLVVIGGGFHGTEVAAVAAKRGVDVTIVDSLAEPLSRGVGDWVGAQVRELHSSRAVKFRLGLSILGYTEQSGRATGVELSDGSTLAAKTVVVAVGTRPNVEWLQDTGIADASGVVCDKYSLAAPNVAAAGDVASWENPRFGRRMRIEHRMNAQEQGMAAVRNLLAAPKDRIPFAPVPYFWSDQFEVKIQAYGHLSADAEIYLAEGSVDSGSFVLTFREHEQLVGAMSWNAPRAIRAYRAMVSDQAARTPTEVSLARV
jgi:3-phenylpropionate/trans-cinnamate dioxygenase ferredoxin reductase subunit